MSTSDQLTAAGYKCCDEQPSWRKTESRADGIEEHEPVWAYLQDER